MGETEFFQLLFPKHLVLRVDAKGRKKYWDAYCVTVETFLRLKGLEAHLIESRPFLEGDEKSEAQRRWEMDDRLCTAVITLNIRGTYLIWLKKSIAEKHSAASLWGELRRGGTAGNSGDDREAKQERRKKSDNETLSNAIFICAGFASMMMLYRIIEKL
ncbi:hypothetical protein GY45DRAFT_1374738 [Cubamyces sp. BRFM 1775]|nr:hypothetical protein GY45DRAFT_1374738 [Cubamyces sp. BRFM 1775]